MQAEQPHAECLFELAQVTRQRGLRDAQRVGGARDAAQPNHGLESSELGQHAVAHIAPQRGPIERSRHLPFLAKSQEGKGLVHAGGHCAPPGPRGPD